MESMLVIGALLVSISSLFVVAIVTVGLVVTIQRYSKGESFWSQYRKNIDKL